MNKELNPFVTVGYASEKYFCDREQELNILERCMKNEVNVTLISNRRLGKSALIYRLFERLEHENFICIYTDIYASQNLKDFTEALALTIFKRFPEKKGFGKRFLDVLKGFRPVITYNVLSSEPEIHFEFTRSEECEHTLRSIFLFLDSQQVKVVLAIDEFQQVINYPETNTEALLRTIIQTLKNSQFIFSGSKKHLMLEMFNTADRPFFSSTQMLGLQEIPEMKYKQFIHEKFEERNRTIDEEAVDFVLSWTLSHTFYTQVICNNMFARPEKNITQEVAKQVCSEQLSLQQVTYMQYRSLLAPVQWRLLIAIAKEGQVSEIQAQTFLHKYKVGGASSAKKALDALLEKEMICTIETPEKTFYRVYNVFLLRWLDATF
ncbi:ATPase [Bacteroidia bacterium]|nr:ATPase [Bacteroidia bacterium]